MLAPQRHSSGSQVRDEFEQARLVRQPSGNEFAVRQLIEANQFVDEVHAKGTRRESQVGDVTRQALHFEKRLAKIDTDIPERGSGSQSQKMAQRAGHPRLCIVPQAATHATQNGQAKTFSVDPGRHSEVEWPQELMCALLE